MTSTLPTVIFIAHRVSIAKSNLDDGPPVILPRSEVTILLNQHVVGLLLIGRVSCYHFRVNWR